MLIKYVCTGLSDMDPNVWAGELTIKKPLQCQEIDVNVRGSFFHIIIGKSINGNFLCIPNWGIGMELSNLSDCFWNFEHLISNYPNLSLVDAISIVDALQKLSQYFND